MSDFFVVTLPAEGNRRAAWRKADVVAAFEVTEFDVKHLVDFVEKNAKVGMTSLHLRGMPNEVIVSESFDEVLTMLGWCEYEDGDDDDDLPPSDPRRLLTDR